MRILAAGEPIPLDKLGFSTHNLERAARTAVGKPYGLFFVCGPTGSGKTTTLHSVLELPQHAGHQDLDRGRPGRDHAEGPAPGADEQEGGPRLRRGDEGVPARRSRTSSWSARCATRRPSAPASRPRSPATWCSPRCTPTRAPESIIRLLDMGMDPFNFADALLGILAQRLAKRLCKCKQPYTPRRGRDQALPAASTATSCMNTATFKKDPKARDEKRVSSDWVKDYGNDKGRAHALQAGRLRHVRRHAATRAACGLHELLVGTDPLKKTDPGARARGRDARHGARGRHAHPEAGRHGEGACMGVTDMKQVRAVCIK